MERKYSFFLALMVAIALCGCDTNQGRTSANEQTYSLSEKDKVILKALLVDEMKTIVSGGDAAFPDLLNKHLGEYVVASSNVLQREYEKNEVAADQKFRRKTIFIKGAVNSIDRGIGENYFIGLNGGSNPFMQPKASMADGYANFLASLEKGDRVSLVCQGNGMLIGSAMLKDCEPSDNYYYAKAGKIISNLKLSDAISKKDKELLSVVMSGMVIASLLPEKSNCFSPQYSAEKCGIEMRKVTDTKNKEKAAAFESAVNSAVEKLKIDKADLKEKSSAAK